MSNKNPYNLNFYQNRNNQTKYSAKSILELLFSYYKPQSLIDFGCGVGTWIKTANELGVIDCLGIEGDWLEKKHLVIPHSDFMHRDLTQKIDLGRRYDIAISMEVAEHIDKKYASLFIENLTRTSDLVLFSAAIPHQRGAGHVNEQWPEYWIELFKERGFIPMDVIRPFIWTDREIKPWYKQNTLLFIHQSRISNFPHLQKFEGERKAMWSVVHPETFLRQVEISHPKYGDLSQVIKSLPGLILRTFRRKIGKLIRR